jgi:MFS family permease
VPGPYEGEGQRRGADGGSAGPRSPDGTDTADSGATRVLHAGGRAARATGRLAGRTVRTARRMTHAHGAGESGLGRLMEMHAVSTAGDAAVAVALAGTLFFQVPTGDARGQVAQFLLLTMLPFAVVAPLIGPFLDRFRRGRRWALGGTMAVRGFCCWVLAGVVSGETSPTLFLAALGVLVSSKAYGVTKASAVPRLVPPGLTLVKTNSRLGLTGTAAAAVSAPIALLLAQIGPQWVLRYAFCLFVTATVLAILLPAQVDSSAGEEQVGLGDFGGSRSARRRFGITPMVVSGLRCNAGLRVLSGFLTMYMAFLLREYPFAGWEERKTLLLVLVVGAAGLGNTVGVLVGSVLKTRKPEATVVVVLLADVCVVVVAAVAFSLPTAVALGLTVGVCQSLGKLSLDALIQRDVPETVRSSVFARSETLMQLSWVVGGFLGIGLPLDPARPSLGFVAALLLVWTVVVVRGLQAQRRRAGAG